MRIPDIRQRVEEELAKGNEGFRIQHASQFISNDESSVKVKRGKLLETTSSEDDSDDDKV